MSKEIFERIVVMGTRMVFDGTRVDMAVAELARINGLNPKQAERLKKRIIKESR